MKLTKGKIRKISLLKKRIIGEVRVLIKTKHLEVKKV